MIHKVEEFCRQKKLFCRGDRILVGLSGGADSVCLFLALKKLSAEWDLTLVAVHINHGLRGAEAEADAKFCEAFCAAQEVPFRCVCVSVEALAKENGWSVEEAGRNARYEVFLRLKEELRCNKIAVAHHKNDQAETVLFQLFRGSRVKGLVGMEAKREEIIRPLLCVTRQEIEQYLKEQGQAYCTDRTNLETEYRRNRIRHRILPIAEEIQQGAAEHVAETAEYLGRVEAYLKKQETMLYEKASVTRGEKEELLRIDVLTDAEELLAERVIYRALCQVAGKKKDMTATAVRECFGLCNKQSGTRLCLPQGVFAEREFDCIRIYREKKSDMWEEQTVSEFPFMAEFPEKNGMICLKRVNTLEDTADFIEKMGGFPKSSYTKWLDYDKIKGSVSLRTVKPGDVMTVYADGRRKAVSDVMAEAKIPREMRKRYPVLADEQEVLWIPGVRGSEGYRITEQTKSILIATLDGGNTNGR